MTQPPTPPPGQGPGPSPQSPYPQGSGGYPQQHPPPGVRPKEVELSFWLWVGSIVVSLLGSIAVLAQLDDIRRQAIAEAQRADPTVDPQLFESVINAALVGGLVFGLLLLALELLFIFKMRAGRNWARIVLTVLAGISVVGALLGLGQPQPALVTITSVLSLLLLIGAVVLMYVRNANPWFQRPRY